MKKFMKSFALLAVAALGLSACNDDKLVPDNGNADGKFVTVHFGAEAAIEGATKATLTTEDEKTFKSAWENGDVLSVEYSNDNTPVNKGIVPATWTADHFDATLPTYKGMWDYNVVYPAPDAESKVDFGSARTQKGNAYNSKYDLMKGGAIETGADAGMTADGKKIVFEMTRQTAIAYFHLTSALDEEVVSAKLSVEGNGAYLSTSDVQIGKDNKGNTSYAQGYAFTETEGVASKEISLTFTGIVPKTSDFKLWFNVLPTIYDKMTLTVETANHTLTISRNATGMYEAGKLYKVVKTIPADKWFEKGGETPVESSYKIEFNSTTKLVNAINASTMASTFVVTGAEYLEAQPFSNPSNAYYGGNETNGLPLRIGKRDASGSITMALSKAGQVNATKIILSAKQFTENKTFAIGVNGSTKQQPGDDYTVLEFPLDGSPLTSIKLDSDGYIFIQSITVVSGPVDNTIPSLSVDQTSKVWAANATDAFVVKVTVNSEGGDWKVTPDILTWATIAVDKTAGTITVTPNGANTAETANEATLTVAHAFDASLTKEITLKQNGKGGEAPKTWTYALKGSNDPKLFEGNPATVNGATWSIKMGPKVGSPDINGTPTKYSNIFGWKWGDSKSNYWSSYTLSTDYFASKSVKSVTVNFLNNASKSATMTVKQGETTIGTATQEFGTKWTDLTANTTQGTGGTLTINYSVDQASLIHSITVEYYE